MSRTIELAEGITASVADDVSSATIAALREVATAARHREQYGYLSREPLQIAEGIDYENRDCVCCSCGAKMPHAPWPTNSVAMVHRPRCGKCNSSLTAPADVGPPMP